jgi:DNA-binding response OmpR family regulator
VRLLLIEDDPRMAALLRRGLVEEGHVIDGAASGRLALDAAQAAQFDVVVLDVMLPDIEGFEVVRALRARGDHTPVLLLTARDTDADVVRGLNAGADDYLTKPFSFEVLLARLGALARRGPALHGVRLRVGDLVLDPSTRTVTRSGAALSLTRTEFSLLEYLMRRSGRVVPRQALLDGVWGCARDVESNTLDAFVKLLRRKVDAGGRPPVIETVRGIGYRVREAS